MTPTTSTTHLIFDPFMGASGDMIIAALIDLGADPSNVTEIMESVAPVTVEIRKTSKNGIAATSVSVVPDTPEALARTYPEIVADIRSAGLPDPIIDDAIAIFGHIASAESMVHNVPLDQLHFHEVGQADAIADVVGACAAIHSLAPQTISCTRIMTGTGFVECAHGTLPVPAPATLEILSNSELSWDYGGVAHELLTPTGAAILAHLAEPHDLHDLHTRRAQNNQGCVARRIGYGAGNADLEIANVLRVILCERGDASLLRDDVEVLETSVDDVTGEVLGNLIEELIAMGAYDAIVIPATMKKGRSGHLIQVTVKPGDSEQIARRIIEETGSLGVRISPTKHRLIARREVAAIKVEIDCDDYDAAIKIATDDHGNLLNISAEFEDAKQIAQRTGIPVREVMRRIVDHAWNAELRSP
ncbi:MAG: hypothetical protein C5S47_04010 [Candidatus Methanogasteraceae archaeon]|nr:MAG: hypothetical protein C5S47_04010 [ANME-2 cluster archaeon]